MQGFSILSQLFTRVIETKFVSGIYHSALLSEIEKGKGLMPVVNLNGRYKYIGIDDTKGFFAYCRQTGPLEVLETRKIGGCQTKQYKTQIPQRLVFFNNHEERSHEDISAVLIKAVIGSVGVKLSKVYSDQRDILKQESPTLTFNFTQKTFYCAIDFFVLLTLQTDNCEQEMRCEGLQNPVTG